MELHAPLSIGFDALLAITKKYLENAMHGMLLSLADNEVFKNHEERSLTNLVRNLLADRPQHCKSHFRSLICNAYSAKHIQANIP